MRSATCSSRNASSRSPLAADRAVIAPAPDACPRGVAARCIAGGRVPSCGLPDGPDMGLEAAIQYERELQAVAMGTADAAEGRRAFAERRVGTFTGR